MAHNEGPFGLCCCGCLHIRSGVIAFMYFVIFLSVCAVFALVSEDTRILVGGYTSCGNWIVNLLGCIGVVLGLMGRIGMSDNNTRWVRWFSNFATIRVILRIYIFWTDFSQLRNCESFGMSSVTSHYNPAMEVVVLGGHCPSTRIVYPLWSVLDILISLYGVWSTNYWCWAVEHGPMYHIALDDSKPLRIYTGYSTVGHPDAPPTVNVVPPTSPGPQFADPNYGYSQGNLAPPQYSQGYGYGGYGGVQQPGTTASIPF